jgi:hypothetical protein
MACAAAIVLLTGGVAIAVGPLFAPYVNYTLGPVGCDPPFDCSQGPIDLTAGDFDGDGNIDIATANVFSDNVTLLFGDGNGALAPVFTATASSGPAGIASGLIDGDPNLDLVVANELSNTISVFLGNGNGTLSSQGDYAMGIAPEGVALADFDHNSNLDVATANLFGDTVSVRLGNGDGTFGPGMQTAVQGSPYRIAVGDLDGDGVLDLAVTLYDASALATLIGNGDGTFLFAGTAAVYENPRGVALADFNGDDDLDAAVATESFDTVNVLLGNGDGTFAPASGYFVGGFPESVVAVDIDGDGAVDLATAEVFGTVDFDSSVSVLLGIGDGSFASAQSYEVALGAFGLLAADLNNDDKPDLATANIDDDTVSVLVNVATPQATLTPTPAPVATCAATPRICRTPAVSGKALMLLKDDVDDAKDVLLWKWLRGAATDASEFGDPVVGEAYRLCVYDDTGLRMEADVPFCPSCWKRRRGFKYRDVAGVPDGLRTVVLTSGGDGDAKIVVRGKGVPLDVPLLTSLGSPLTVQLNRAGAPVCWGATYSFPPALKNDAATFKDKAD